MAQTILPPSKTSYGKPSVPASRWQASQRRTARSGRADQLARHEIRVQPHVDALLLVAEKAWRARLQVQRAHQAEILDALFVPRSRRWALDSP